MGVKMFVSTTSPFTIAGVRRASPFQTTVLNGRVRWFVDL